MACALGYALVGKYGDPRKALKLYEKKVGRMRGGCCKEAVAALLKVPFELVKTINWLHLSGVRATQITKRLRSGEL